MNEKQMLEHMDVEKLCSFVDENHAVQAVITGLHAICEQLPCNAVDPLAAHMEGSFKEAVLSGGEDAGKTDPQLSRTALYGIIARRADLTEASAE